MKKVIIAAALIFAGFTTVTTAQAQESKAIKTEKEAMDQNEKEIEVEQLPSAVQTALKGDEYKGWTVSSASMVEGKASKDGSMNEKPHYKLQVTNGTESKIITLDEMGKKVA